jgi:hypothetical protein
LRGCAQKYGLYLDFQKPRAARKGNKKVRWLDAYDNKHDLDYVFERNGSEKEFGTPVGIVEVAWRAYTKHSKNKVQEIEGAVLPLTERYSSVHPFKGVILGGEYTKAAITQLESRGFKVLFLPLKRVVDAFKSVGIDARFDESTAEKVFDEKIKAFKALTPDQKDRVCKALFDSSKPDVAGFLKALDDCFSRQVARIVIIALHGKPQELATPEQALSFLESYNESTPAKAPLFKYEISVRFNNGDEIHNATFKARESAVDFLKSFLPIPEAKPATS